MPKDMFGREVQIGAGYPVEKAFAQMSDSNLSTHPALMRDVSLYSLDDNWWHTLNNTINDVTKSRYQDDIDKIDDEAAELKARVYKGQYNGETEKLDLLTKIGDLEYQKEPIKQKIADVSLDTEQHPISPDYEAQTIRSILDNEDRTWGETATDIGGTASEWKNQALLAGSQVATMQGRKYLGQYLAKKAASSLAASAASGETLFPIVTAGLLLYDAASFLGTGVAAYQLRKRETASEVSDARHAKYDELISNLQRNRGGRELLESEKNEAWIASKDGIDQVRDANMDLFLSDYAQSFLLVAPWTKVLGKATSMAGGKALANRVVSSLGVMPLESLSEGAEEGVQYLASERYKQGEDTGSTWDLTTEAYKGIFGNGTDPLTQTNEFEKATDTGMLMGGVFGISSVFSAANETRKYHDTKRRVYEAIKSTIEEQEVQSKVNRIDDLYKKGRLDYVKDIVEDINTVLLDSKGISGLTEDDVQKHKTILSDTTSALERIYTDPTLEEVAKDPILRKQVAGMIVNEKNKIRESNVNLGEIKKNEDEIYTAIANKYRSDFSTPSYLDQVKKEKTSLNAQLTNLESDYSKKQLEFEQERKNLEEGYGKKLKNLTDFYSDITTQFDSDNYASERISLDKAKEVDMKSVNAKYASFEAVTKASIATLQSKLAGIDIDNVSLDDMEVKNLVKLNSTLTALKAKIKDVEAVIKKDAQNNDNSKESSKRKDVLKQLTEDYKNAELINKVLTEALAEERAGIDSNSTKKSAVKSKIKDLITKANESDANKDGNSKNLLVQYAAYEYDHNNQIKNAEAKLGRWGEDKNVKINKYEASANLLEDASDYIDIKLKPQETAAKPAAPKKVTVVEEKPINDLPETDDRVLVMQGYDKVKGIVNDVIGDKVTVQLLDQNDNPKGSPIDFNIKEVELVQKNDLSDENTTDSITEQESPTAIVDQIIPEKGKFKSVVIKFPLRNIFDAVSTSHSEDNDIVARDLELSKFISTFSNEKSLKEAESNFTIDWHNDIFKKELRSVKERWDNKTLTSNDIDLLVKEAPIKITIKSGDKTFAKGLYMHLPSYARTPIEEGGKVIGYTSHLLIPKRFEGDVDKINEYINAEIAKINNARREIIKHLKNGNKVTSIGLSRSKGKPNNITDGRFQISEAWNIDIKKVDFAIIGPTGTRAYSSEKKDRSRDYVPGQVYASTTKTCNGDEATLRLNPSRLSEEHAGILFDSIVLNYQKGEGKKSQFSEEYKKANGIAGLTIGEIQDMLVVSGTKTKIKGKEEVWFERGGQTLVNTMAEKQLYVERVEDDKKRSATYTLHFGQERSFWLHDDNKNNIKAARKDFIRWATANKNYPVILEKDTLLGGVKLNEKVTKDFKLGSWEYKASEAKTYGQILADNPVAPNTFAITTDVREYEGTGSLFKDPVLILNSSEGTVQFKVANKEGNIVSQPVTPKPAPKTVNPTTVSKPVEANAKVTYKEISPIKDLHLLEDGTELFLTINGFVGDSVAGIVMSSDGVKVIIDPTTNEALSLQEFRKELGAFKINIKEVQPIAEVESTDEDIEDAQEDLVASETNKQTVIIGDITATHVINKYGAVENEIINNKTGEGILQLVTPSGKVTYAPLIGFNFVESVGKYSGRSLSEQTNLIFSGIPISEILSKFTSNSVLEEVPEIKTELDDDFDSEVDAETYNKLKDILNKDDKPTDPKLTRLVKQDRKAKLVSAKKELEQVRKLIGSTFSTKIVDDFIQVASNGKLAWATMERDLLTMVNIVEEGTGFHEAFHRVSMLLIPVKDRFALYDQARLRYANKLKEQFGVKESYTNNEVEEVLAEEFRSYMLDKSTYENKILGRIKNLFERIYNLIKYYILKRNPFTSTDIDKMFSAISKGRYKYAQPIPYNYEQFGNSVAPRLVVRNQAIQSIDTADQLNKVISSLMAVLFQVSDVVDLNDTKNAKFELVKTFLKVQGQEVKKEADKVNDIELKNELLRKFNLYKEIYNNFNDTFYPILDRQLKALKIEIDNDLNTVSDDMSFETVEDNFIVNADKFSVEEDVSKKVLPAIKFLLATLKEQEANDEFTGLPIYGGFSKNWRELIRELHYTTSIEQMMEKVDKLSQTEYKWSQLKNKLNVMNPLVKIQFHQVMRKHRHNFVNLNVSTDKGNEGMIIKDFFYIDTIVQNEKNNLINSRNGGVWGKGLVDSYIAVKEKGQTTRLSLDKFKEVISEHKKLKDYLSTWVKEKDSEITNTEVQNKIISLLSKVGLSIDNRTLDFITFLDTDDAVLKREKAYDFVDSLSHMFSPNGATYQYISDSNAGKLYTKENKKKYENTKPYNILSQEGIIKSIAESYVNSHLYKMNDMVYGADAKPYYAYSENSIVSDTIYALKDGDETINEMLDSVNNRNSVILNKLKNNPNTKDQFDVVTFAAFNDQDSDDISQEYVKLNQVEDYITKLLAANSGYLPFPVLASKKMYYMFRGLSDKKGTPVIKAGDVIDGKFSFTDAAVNTFYGYFLDETNRIARVQKNIDDATNEKGITNYNNLVQYVHFRTDKNDVKYHKAKDIKELPAGLKYITFPSFNKPTIDLTDEQAVKDSIRKMLTSRLQKEILIAKQLNIITDKNENIKIPQSLYNKVSETNTKDTAVQIILADSMVNQMVGVIETEKIISGEPISYKQDKKTGMPTDDQIKRLSVLSSTGANLVTSMTDTYLKKGTQEPFDSTLTSQTYKSATLKSNVVISAYLKDLEDIYTDIHVKHIGDIAVARELAKKDLSNYAKGGDSTDAQALIPPMMYRQIKMRLGEWSDYHQEAFEALISDKVLTQEDEHKYRKFHMEPVKLVFFGHERKSHGIDIAEYDKMSLATLFPRDISKYEDIQKLYEAMEHNKVNMVLFDSATKSGNRDTRDFYSDDNVTVSNLHDSLGKISRDKEFKYLRRQLMTDPHDEANHKVGTQVLKVILGNIMKNVIYKVDGKNVTGQELLDIYFSSLKQLSNNGRVEVLASFGMNDDGSSIDDAVLINSLLEDAEEGKMPMDLIDALRTFDGNIVTNLDVLSNIDWIANRIISKVTKKTIDLELPGGSMVQQSNIGFRKTDKSAKTKLQEYSTLKDHDKYIQWVRHTEGVQDLKFYTTDKDGGLIGMECLISVSMFKRVVPNYSGKTIEEIQEWIKENNPEIIGYRIPTQGQASIVALRVAGFLPETSGDTVVLPSEFTALTGSDFDIDKLYTLRYNYERLGKIAHKIKFLTKEKGSDEYKLYEEVKELESISAEKRKEIEEKLSKIPAFDKKYDRKVRELFGFYKHLFQSLPEFESLFEKLNKEYDLLDKKDSSIKTLKIELDNKKNDIANTTDPDKKIKLKKEVAYINGILNSKRKSLEDVEGFNDAVLDTYIQSREGIENVANVLIANGKFVDKVDFLMKDEYYQNTNKAIQNRLISVMFGVLKNFNHIYHTTKPLDVLKDVLTRRAGKLKDKEELGDLERLSPAFQSKIKIQYASGKPGVGFSALANAHHPLAQAVDLLFKANLRLGKQNKQGNTALNLDRGLDDRYITDWTSALINSFVDIEKDPYIINLNVNNATYNLTYLMLRLGMGEYTFDFLPQQILKDYAELVLMSQGNITDIKDESQALELTRLKYQEAFDDAVVAAQLSPNEGETMGEMFKREFGDISDTMFNITNKEVKHLTDLFAKPEGAYETAKWNYLQLQVLDEFVRLNEYANQLSSVVKYSQIDTKKFGSNILEIRSFMNGLKDTLRKGKTRFVGLDKLISFDTKTNNVNNIDGSTHLATQLNNSVVLLENILAGKMIQFTDGFKAQNDYILRWIGKRDTTGKKVINQLGKELHTTIISKFFTGKDYLNIDAEKLNELYKGENSIYNRIYNIQKAEFLPIVDGNGNKLVENIKLNKVIKANPLFNDLLIPEYRSDIPPYLRVAFRKDDDVNTDMMITAFKELLMSDNKEVKKLGEDLLLYSYFSSGYKRTVFSMHQFTPTLSRSQMITDSNQTYNEFISEQLINLSDASTYGIETHNVAKEVIKNSWNNNSIVPRIYDTKGKGKAKLNVLTPQTRLNNKNTKMPFFIQVNHMNEQLGIGFTNIMDNGEALRLYKPYIKFNVEFEDENGKTRNRTMLGEYIGFDDKTKSPIYKTVPKTSISKAGVVIKENGLDYGIVEETPKSHFLLTREQELAMMEKPGFKSVFPNFKHVPIEKQVVFSDEIDFTKDMSLDEIRNSQAFKDFNAANISTSPEENLSYFIKCKQ